MILIPPTSRNLEEFSAITRYFSIVTAAQRSAEQAKDVEEIPTASVKDSTAQFSAQEIQTENVSAEIEASENAKVLDIISAESQIDQEDVGQILDLVA